MVVAATYPRGMPSVFSAIIAGDLPGRFVWEDEDVVAFLTIAPVTQGHTLIVPRKEVDQWQDVDDELFDKCTAVSRKVARAVRQAFDAPRAGFLIAGLEVPHLHMHVFPAYTFSSRCSTRTSGNSAANPRAMGRVRSLLALSAMVIRAVYGTSEAR